MSKRKKQHPLYKGFTLIEVMIAILILLDGVLVVLQLFPLGYGVEQANQMKNQAVFLCQEKIETMISEPYKDIAVGTIDENPMASPFQRFERETKVSYVDSNLNESTSDIGLKKIEVTVSWQSPLRVERKNVQFVTLIAER